MAAYLITGANRGIGLAIIEQLYKDEKNLIIATVRNQSTAENLEKQYPRVKTIVINMADSYAKFESAFKLIDQFTPHGIDCLIANAGVLGEDALFESQLYDVDQYLDVMNINVGGVAKTYKAGFPYLFKTDNGVSKKFIIMSSVAGTTGGFVLGANAYGASKAAVNHLGKQIAEDNKSSGNELVKNSITILQHPGHVLSEMGADVAAIVGDEKFVSTEECAIKLVKLLNVFTVAHTGGFFDENGETMIF
ncbi:uncharacterized oxidoreductase [[Candida] jaroonii]|uniref:Uncharacterized oxidoreductase n=1 Tax=[Candida] jaroonii TaxID=467808 RepID=A0ACA9Y8I0_9ASCO|nr:uncharacterized oxidoreductase [[Candida] jaroonii]